MSLSFSPIFPWPVIAIAAGIVLGLTIWAYYVRLRGTSGGWRWLAIALRMLAVLMCVMATLRPSLILSRKVKQPASLVFLVDASTSMGITDEVRGQSRRDVATATLVDARDALKALGQEDLEVKYYAFGGDLSDMDPDQTAPVEPQHETAIGTALIEALKRQSGTRLASIVLLSDGGSNAGLPPLDAAERLRTQQVPVVAVGFGTASAGSGSRDLAARELIVPSTVYSKNQMPARGTLRVRGFANQPIDVDLLVEGVQVATKQVQAAEGQEVVSVSGLTYTPDTAGEKRVTLRVQPKDGELVKTNNEYTTYVTVMSGGLNVLFLQGPSFTWEYKYLVDALDASPEIHADLKVLRNPARADGGMLDDTELAGKYDVYIIGDLPADRLTRAQHALLKQAVDRGAGLIALGGRDSFGAGGWASTPLADVLPVTIHPGDGQVDPGEAGLKVVPHPGGSDDYLMQIAPTKAASAEMWARLPTISGANRFGPPKRIARVLADTPQGEPILVAMDIGQGRVIAFGGETWPWARAAVLQADEQVAAAHRKFWRQVILWLAHKEDDNQSQVKLMLDRRRVALGQKLDLAAKALDEKGQPMTGVQFETTITPLSEPGATSQKVEMVNQGDEARGSYFATKQVGEFRATVTAKKGDADLGSASARFLVFQDDLELSNPAADPSLLRRIAETTAGKYLPHEKLADYLKTLDTSVFTEYAVQSEHRLVDNWPFLLVFAIALSLEWWLRKRHGWV
jgi:uncharacterized membrane protein